MLKNHCLVKGIASASWSEFFIILSYKSDWKGVNLIRIGRFEPSSKMCECGYIHWDLKLSDRIWACPSCGAVNDRDLLAARNIKKFGLEKQNLLTQENINKTPVVNWEGDVELSAVVGVVKRQNVLV
jgi:putative transposase